MVRHDMSHLVTQQTLAQSSRIAVEDHTVCRQKLA
jgi:hypothetical protein